MMSRIHILLLVVMAVLLCSCAGIQPKTPDTALPSLSENKNYVLSEMSKKAQNACSYSGRATLRYNDSYQQGTARSVIRKECSGDMTIRILGVFGSVAMEIMVRGDEYTLLRKGADVTAEPPVNIREEDIILLKEYFRLPPPMPDESYVMVIDKSQYLFTSTGSYFTVTPDYHVTSYVTPDHTVAYQWEKDDLKAMGFSRMGRNLAIDFNDPWVTR